MAHLTRVRDLVEHFVLYFPESKYLLDDGFLIPRRLISGEGYDGCLKEADGAAQAIPTSTWTCAARQKLLEPGGKVDDVARQVGFLDTGTFIRSFKKVEGMTPGVYRA